MRTDDETTYREFAAVQLQALQRPAICSAATGMSRQDLVQTTLVKMYGAWPRLRPRSTGTPTPGGCWSTPTSRSAAGTGGAARSAATRSTTSAAEAIDVGERE